MSRVVGAVQRALRRLEVTAPPVPVREIAESYGIVVREEAAPADVSGALLRSQEGAVIVINSEQHPNRQRFTIAHELGHFLLHEGTPLHVDHDFRVNMRNSRSSQAADWEEIEANQFAAELLIPQDFLRSDLESGKHSAKDAARLARRYRVSEAAMSYRFVNLGLTPQID